MTRSVRAIVHRFLLDQGITTIFGNPGSTEMRFFRDLPAGIDYVMVPQEAAALAMADGHAQATGGVGMVLLHSATGLGHALGSLYTAERNGTPLVVVAGQQSRALLTGDPYLVARRPTEFPQPYVKVATEPGRAQDVPTVLAQAFRHAALPPAGPVFVSVPEDDWDDPGDEIVPRQVTTRYRPVDADLDGLLDALAAAARPALVLGARVAAEGARARVAALAEALDAPAFVAPVAARSPFPEDHPLFAGFLPPVAAAVREQLAPFDLVLVLGAPVVTAHLPSAGPPVPAATRLVQVVDDPRQAALAAVGDTVLGSVGPVVDALLDRLAPGTPRAPVVTHPEQPPGMAPEAVLAELARVLPDDAVVVEEAPTHRNALHAHLPITAGRDFFVAASGGLGWGLPAAVGIAMARPDRPVVCLVGDGSSLYAVQALWTAAHRGARVLFVVLDNGGYAAMKAFGALLDVPDAPGLDLPGLDVAQVARGFGVPAVTITTRAELTARLAAHDFRAPGPQLWDVRVEGAGNALY